MISTRMSISATPRPISSQPIAITNRVVWGESFDGSANEFIRMKESLSYRFYRYQSISRFVLAQHQQQSRQVQGCNNPYIGCPASKKSAEISKPTQAHKHHQF